MSMISEAMIDHILEVATQIHFVDTFIQYSQYFLLAKTI